MIFWWRRWMLHSRSNRATVAPWASASTCTSIWRGAVRYRSRNTVPSPKAEAASRRALSTASARSAGAVTIRMPLPPPPAEALMSRGKPRAATSASDGRVPSVRVTEGSVATPAVRMRSLLATLEPIRSMASGDGPTQSRPASRTRRAKSPFSERKP